jgi:hypothetical protein
MKSKYIIIVIVAALIVTVIVLNRPKPPVPECIRLPVASDKTETEASAKLYAELHEKIGKPSLETAYKDKVEVAYVQLDQQSMQQLVLIEFLICLKQHHAKDVSPETMASMEHTLQIAINKAAGAQSLSGPVTVHAKESLEQTKYGSDKVKALSDLGL